MTAILTLPPVPPPINRLPPFCRVSWTSQAARDLWEPRFKAVRLALRDLGYAVDHPHTECPSGTAPCCRAASAEIQPGQAAACDDPVWLFAVRSNHANPAEPSGIITLDAPWNVNPLLAPLGLRAWEAWPCHAKCQAAAESSARLMHRALESPHVEALRWLSDALAWPASWSALHGIVEVKTPVLRYIRNTGQTPRRLQVNWAGAHYPELAGRGLRFPFQPRRTAKPARNVNP